MLLYIRRVADQIPKATISQNQAHYSTPRHSTSNCLEKKNSLITYPPMKHGWDYECRPGDNPESPRHGKLCFVDPPYDTKQYRWGETHYATSNLHNDFVVPNVFTGKVEVRCPVSDARQPLGAGVHELEEMERLPCRSSYKRGVLPSDEPGAADFSTRTGHDTQPRWLFSACQIGC